MQAKTGNAQGSQQRNMDNTRRLSIRGKTAKARKHAETGSLLRSRRAVPAVGRHLHIVGDGTNMRLLLVADKRLNESEARAGPSVMNTRQEAMDASQDIPEGRFDEHREE